MNTLFLLFCCLFLPVIFRGAVGHSALLGRIPIQQPQDTSKPNKTLWTVDWSPDDRFLATGGVDSTVHIFDAKTLVRLKTYKTGSWIHVVKWHPAGKILAVATLENYVHLWNTETGEVTRLDSTGGSRGIGWNYTGDLLAVAELSGNIRLYSKAGMLVRSITRQYSDDQVGRSFLSLDWHPSENLFVTTNYKIQILDTGGKVLQAISHNNPAAIVLCAEWHPSGNYFVVGDYGHNWEGENVPSLLNAWTKKGQLLWTRWGSKAEYRNIAWSRTGSRLASASDALRIWSSKGKLLHTSRLRQPQKFWGIDWNGSASTLVLTNDLGQLLLFKNNGRLLKWVPVIRN